MAWLRACKARETADSAMTFIPSGGRPALEMILFIVRRQRFAAIGVGRPHPRLSKAVAYCMPTNRSDVEMLMFTILGFNTLDA